MAIKNQEREAARRLSHLHQNFRTMKDNISWYAKVQIVSTKDNASDVIQRLLNNISMLVCERDNLISDMQYLMQSMQGEVKRLNRGQLADDVTRSTTFTNLSAKIGVFNYRLREAAIEAYTAGLWVLELMPHLDRFQLTTLRGQADARLQMMNTCTTTDEEELGRFIGDCREFLSWLELRLRMGMDVKK